MKNKVRVYYMFINGDISCRDWECENWSINDSSLTIYLKMGKNKPNDSTSKIVIIPSKYVLMVEDVIE